MTAYPTKPSGPSEHSADTGSLEVSKQTIYRLGHTDLFAYNNCKKRVISGSNKSAYVKGWGEGFDQ